MASELVDSKDLKKVAEIVDEQVKAAQLIMNDSHFH